MILGWMEAIGSAVRGLIRRPGYAVVAVSTIAASLIAVAATRVVARNVDTATAELAQDAELILYLKPEVGAERGHELSESFAALSGVVAANYVSAAAARDRLMVDPAQAELFHDVEVALFPATIEVSLRRSVSHVAAGALVTERLMSMPEVESVETQQQWSAKARAVRDVALWVGGSLFALLALLSVYSVFVVLALSGRMRTKENRVLASLGARHSVVRRSLWLQGALLGAIGGVVAIAATGTLFKIASDRIHSAVEGAFSYSVRFLPQTEMLLVLAVGVALGCSGGLVAARRNER